ncbi:hypothetical protein [Segatella copri]|uniref:hypothetical protein n=1 Tax=Segatella copri TaxID=165179 RepID=UPI003F59E646
MNQYINKGENINKGETLGKEGFTHFGDSTNQASCSQSSISQSSISQDCIESAYCFIHQKLRVYEFSTNPTQRDDIEYAISQYVDGMNPHLYQKLAAGRDGFLLDHVSFEQDMRKAQEQLEKMMV